MPEIIPYNRQKALEYTSKWAFGRNPRFFNYDSLGGDCTNFVSQVLLAGESIMNYKKNLGWYYITGSNKSPSWTGVNFLYKFLTSNSSLGPFVKEVSVESIVPGDIVQLNFETDSLFDHTLIITSISEPRDYNSILVSSHTINRLNEPLSSIKFKQARFLHVLGSYR